jgi:hypothetical protein
MQQSLNAHHSAGWTNSIGTAFDYVPDPVSAAKFPEALATWDRTEELSFAQVLFAAEVTIDAQLVVNGSECPSLQGSTVEWSGVEYSVIVSGTDGSAPLTYRGIADLEFILEGTFWYLHRWTDLHGAAAPWNEIVVCPTFGELRAAYHAR